jgi:hypothetical protein
MLSIVLVWAGLWSADIASMRVRRNADIEERVVVGALAAAVSARRHRTSRCDEPERSEIRRESWVELWLERGRRGLVEGLVVWKPGKLRPVRLEEEVEELAVAERRCFGVVDERAGFPSADSADHCCMRASWCAHMVAREAGRRSPGARNGMPGALRMGGCSVGG